MLGCAPKPNSDATAGGIQKIQFTECSEGGVAVEYFIDDMGHVWPGGKSRLPERIVGQYSDRLNATDVIWDFFKSHPMKRSPQP
jgi:polyhydroxybutyrate depolymerase